MTPLCSQFSNIFKDIVGKNCKVGECFERRGWKWDKILRGVPAQTQGNYVWIRDLKEVLANKTPGFGEDVIRWRWSNTEDFSVRSTYTFLQDGGVKASMYHRIWKIKAPLKVKIFVWITLRGRILTVDKLLLRGWIGEDWCVFCTGITETIDHLLVECEGVRALLGVLLVNKIPLRVCDSARELWEHCSLAGGPVGRRETTTIAATWWTIWLECNRRVFEDRRCSLRQLWEATRALGSP